MNAVLACNNSLPVLALGGLTIRPVRRACLGVSLWVLANALLSQSAVAEDSSGQPAVLPQVTVSGDAMGAGTIGEDENSPGHDSYLLTTGKTGAKMDVPAKDVPQAVIDIPQRVLAEQNSLYLNDTMRNVSGAQPLYSSLSDAPIFKMRGFQARNIYRDGLRDETYDRSYWLGDIDRVEVLKGPASVMYGDGNLGGTINFVTKAPQTVNTIGVSGWRGTFNTSGGSADASVRLSDDGSTLVRGIFDKSYSDTYVDGNPIQLQHFALIGQSQVNDSTTVTLRVEDRERNSGVDTGLPVYGTLLGPNLNLSRSNNYNTAWSRREDIGRSIAGIIDHQINEDWSFHSGLAVNYYDFSQTLSIVNGYNAAKTQLTRYAQRASSPTYQTTNDNYVQGDISVFGLDNKVVAGTEFGYSSVTRHQYNGTVASISTSSTADWAAASNYALSSDLSFDEWRIGHYLQDQITLAPGLKLMAGLRFDNVGRDMRENKTQLFQDQRNAALSERLGVTYEFLPGLTAYGGYSHSFVPPGTTVSISSVTGKLFKPETGDNYELGLKADITDRLTTTAAVYQLTRQNVVSTDPATNLSTATGEQRSRGFELDSTFKIAPGWNLLANYAYTDARVTKDPKYLVGSMVDNVPLNSAKLWSVYEIKSGPAAGLGFGGGVTYVGKREGILTTAASPGSDYVLPEYATVDLTAYYKLEKATISVNATNILDKYYFESGGTYTAYAGQPATVIGRISVAY